MTYSTTHLLDAAHRCANEGQVGILRGMKRFHMRDCNIAAEEKNALFDIPVAVWW